MSSYEPIPWNIAKQIKDSGFPQEDGYYVRNPETGEEALAPTLAELIKQCGSGFGKLEKVGDEFWAYPPEVAGIGLPSVQKAIKPEVALANLYFALNAKDQKVNA